MRTDKHSIGPWSLRRDRNGEECGAVLDHEGQLVATTGYRASPVDNCAEDDANARLIACAPEMLDALRAICFMTHENSGDVLKRARALIEKATRSNESHSARKGSEKSVGLQPDHRGIQQARSSEGGIGGTECAAESIQVRAPVVGNPDSGGAGELEAKYRATSVDPAPVEMSLG